MKMSKRFTTGKVRASYVSVFNPRLNDLSGKEEYSMMLLIPKTDTATVEKIKNEINGALREKFGTKPPASWRNPLRDGDKEGDGGVPDGTPAGAEPYGGHYFMNVKSNQKPGVVDANLNPIIDSSEFVSGDYCRVSLNAYAYDAKGNKGVSFGLGNVQVMEKGEPLGSSVRAEDEFGVIDSVGSDHAQSAAGFL